MKVGQTLANFPDIAPKEFVETLERLQYDAPPMHWALLREMVHNELRDDPENVFASFEKRAFAAASLGQVHRAQLSPLQDGSQEIHDCLQLISRLKSMHGHRKFRRSADGGSGALCLDALECGLGRGPDGFA